MSCDVPPFAFRATPDAIYLVGTAAAPVGDDELSIRVTVEAGARLNLRSAASTIAWGSTGSSLSIEVEIEAGGYLDWRLQPLVATKGCDFSQSARVSMAEDAGLRWTEEVVLGRHGEAPGDLSLRLDVDVGGRALLRHQLAVGPARGWDGPAVLGDNRAVGLVLVAGTVAGDLGVPAAGPGWAVMPLAGPGALTQAVGRDISLLRNAFCHGGVGGQ